MKPLFLLIILGALVCSSCSTNEDQHNSTGENFYVKEILRDKKGDFDPWNTKRWTDWYNSDGELIRQFDIDTSVRFMSREEPWLVRFSESYSRRDLFVVAKQGITLDGNGLVMDVRTEQQSLPLEEVYALRKEPWNGGNEIRCIYYQLPFQEGVQSSLIKNFTFKGWKRGVKVNGTGDVQGHRLMVEDCIFTRNRVGFYTNGYNTLLKDCQFFENGYGAIYSGSGSRGNQFIGNTFRDNTLSQHQHSYGDFIGDTFSGSEISNNRFQPSEIISDFRRVGISMFRNMGEGNSLRKQLPHNNIIKNNHFDGYSVAIHIGARMGRDTRNDVTDEGRDYAFNNLIDSNYIENTVIGIKINTEGNIISHNDFDNVKEEIVLHNVFFKLGNTTINYQKDAQVKVWYVADDYTEYLDWFKFQDDLNGSITKSEKRITVFSEVESPVFPSDLGSIFQLNPSEPEAHWLDDYRAGPPFDVASGEFSLDLPGEETVAIYDEPITRIEDKDYYSILIYDQEGNEINRCGRSEIRWKQIATGYFVRKAGEMEIAAVADKSVEGKYPVFIFDRGYRVPKDTLYKDNIDPGIVISADQNDLVVSFQ